MNQPLQHKLTEAAEGTKGDHAADGNIPSSQPQGNDPDPTEIAEETRRDQQARSHGRPDRDDNLVKVGRGQQTHG
jgi:hypothetical protein